jgi:hypothetical protein
MLVMPKGVRDAYGVLLNREREFIWQWLFPVKHRFSREFKRHISITFLAPT